MFLNAANASAEWSGITKGRSGLTPPLIFTAKLIIFVNISASVWLYLCEMTKFFYS